MARPRKPKAVQVEFIDPAAKTQPKGDPYAVVARLVERHHEDLAEARIALAWRLGWKADPDGHLRLGQAKKCSDLDREFHDHDFVLLLNRRVWNEVDFSAKQIDALLDHELSHCDVAREKKTGDVKHDERGRPIWRIRKHDVEEFDAVVRRHGCWKRDLEAFVRTALERQPKLFAEPAPEGLPPARAPEPAADTPASAGRKGRAGAKVLKMAREALA